MRKFKVSFSTEEVTALAERYFVQSSGIGMETERDKRMYRDAVEVKEGGLSGINIRAAVSAYEGDVFRNHKIVADGIELSCEAFSQIPDDNVKAVYLYVITAGECVCGEAESILKRLYADLWGSAYIDAGRDFLAAKIKLDITEKPEKNQRVRGYLSNSFGPGFYGMRMEENKRIDQILQGSEIGVRVQDNGSMLPHKSCSGLYLVVKSLAGLPEADCMYCVGNQSGCDFCKIRGPRN